MFVISESENSTCGPVPLPPSDPLAISVPRGALAYVTRKKQLWDIGHMQSDLQDHILKERNAREGTTILVYEFLQSEFEGNKQFVKETIKEWEQHANVKFMEKEEESNTSDIRILFGDAPSSWAYMGPPQRNQKHPTVYLGGMCGARTREEKAIILHEFGHVLGMLHEHQSPTRGGDIVLNERAVYNYYGAHSREEKRIIKEQFLDVFDSDKSNFSEFDPKSIMLYPIPAKLIKEGKPVKVNRTLSPLDKAYIQLAYPHNSSRRLLNAMGTIGIPDLDALNIIKPLMKPTNQTDDSEDLISRLEEVRDAFFYYNKKKIEAKALLKVKKVQAARANRHRR
ncbi:hypothetical protein JVU11DRAFT_11697 [Chiua virens]|nr:hypothetical protein JVU11DRAFT_11697 [Chiua virens]